MNIEYHSLYFSSEHLEWDDIHSPIIYVVQRTHMANTVLCPLNAHAFALLSLGIDYIVVWHLSLRTGKYICILCFSSTRVRSLLVRDCVVFAFFLNTSLFLKY